MHIQESWQVCTVTYRSYHRKMPEVYASKHEISWNDVDIGITLAFADVTSVTPAKLYFKSLFSIIS